MVLAAFDDATLALVDVVDVGMDRLTYISQTLRVGPGDEIFAVANNHFNSSQSYDAITLVMLRDEKFGQMQEIYLFGDRYCGYEQVQSLDLAASGGAGSYWPIVATVTDRLSLNDEDCGDDVMPEPFEKVLSVTFNWSASLGGYVADSDALERLAAENSERY